ncbi:MAG: acetyl-CoA carboxylase biotin carboxyl carrier protein [Alphaproteobacteria bacterium]|nr:acetyl-CoA carboxylase biotin carboxyl carrier protein [Alphaproteobacteria bacterium]
MNFDIEYIEKLSKVLNDNELTEISLEDGDNAITIRKDVIVSPAAVVPAGVSAPAREAEAVSDSKKGTPIVSPMVGTFYTSPSPDAKPFVTVGQTVSKGDKVCIIEAMKLMNEIETEISGKIVEICVQDGQPVEFGQILMYVE